MKKSKRLIVILSIILLILISTVVILLLKDNSKKEVSNPEETVEDTDFYNEEVYGIETKYCDLYYPKQWKENINVEIEDEEPYVVKFYGHINDKEEQYLFGIEFGECTGDVVGTYKSKAEELSIAVLFNELEFDDSYTADEMSTMNTMQEDLNYILENLKNEDGYSSAY